MAKERSDQAAKHDNSLSYLHHANDIATRNFGKQSLADISGVNIESQFVIKPDTAATLKRQPIEIGGQQPAVSAGYDNDLITVDVVAKYEPVVSGGDSSNLSATLREAEVKKLKQQIQVNVFTAMKK